MSNAPTPLVARGKGQANVTAFLAFALGPLPFALVEMVEI